MAFTIQIRRDTAANWTGTNPTLLQGEQGLETDTGKVKIGDGSTAWNSLAYNSDGVDWTGANTNFSTTGSIDATSALFDGSSDQVQVTVQGHSTQTSDIFVIENSAGTDLFSVDNAGNVTVSGTVDGRDLATDGSKLDGIEAGATADQTGSEIKTLYEAEADTNAYTDAEKSKLAGIEAGADVTDQVNVTAALADGTIAGTVLIDGQANATQLTVQGNATQTSDIFVVENSAGVDLFTVNNSGNVTVAGTVDGRDLSTDGSKLDGIEAGADVTDGTNVQAALADVPSFKLGDDLSGDRFTYIDFHSDDANAAYSARIFRDAGTNGVIRIMNNGTGPISFVSDGSFSMNVYSSAVNVLKPLVVDGTTDDIQLKVQGNSVQTSDIFVVETSAGTDLLTVDNSGNTAITGTITAAGLPSGATAVAAGAATNELWVTSGHATLPDGVVMRA